MPENKFFYETKEYKQGSIPDQAIADCSGSGKMDEPVAYWVKELDFNFPVAWGAEWLIDYGAWDEEQLADHEENRLRVFWMACCDISEGEFFGMLH